MTMEFHPADTTKGGFHVARREFVFPINVLGSAAEAVAANDLPDAGVVHDAYVNVRVPEATAATKTLVVGLDSGEAGGDADGFGTGVDVSATGLQRVSGGALGYPHVLNGTAKSPSVTPAGADFAELVADLHVIVWIPAEVIR